MYLPADQLGFLVKKREKVLRQQKEKKELTTTFLSVGLAFANYKVVVRTSKRINVEIPSLKVD